MITNRSSRPISRLAMAVILVSAIAVAGCSGGGGDAQLSDGDVRSNVDDGAGAGGETDLPPVVLAEKEPPTECANALGTGDPAFEAAFCAYSEAARAATSGPDGVTGIEPSLLRAAEDAQALFPDDPAAALALLQSATESLGG
ncbi:MAG: hypothetical protein ACE367_00750 [Acidimicrobiales bacterium]